MATNIYNLIILDASGSMSSIYQQALTGVNETISTIRQAQTDIPDQPQYLTLASFSGSDDIQRVYSATPITHVHNISSRDYQLRGCTALYDAMGDTITELRSIVLPEDKVLVTIITDGYENASRRWDSYKIHELVEELRKRDWIFTYIGANQDAAIEASKIGVRNSLNFEATIQGTVEMFERESRSRRKWNEKVFRKEADLETGYFDEEVVERCRITPERIDRLASNEVFVFGSNIQGHHLGGAARAAMERFGAVWGQGVGLQGQSYAIPTMGGIEPMRQAIDDYIRFAKANPDKRFLTTRIGCGIAGYDDKDIAPLFREAMQVNNITLPASFWKILNR